MIRKYVINIKTFLKKTLVYHTFILWKKTKRNNGASIYAIFLGNQSGVFYFLYIVVWTIKNVDFNVYYEKYTFKFLKTIK